MASLLPGFEYDIFISYRQKDNKHDGWVTEFVNQLTGELEATFKEDISIYFDENPHDGLLETYSVDKSLEIKLRCLIFIPIISQTYCDPKSFAWQHEFCAFNKLAQEDQFGRDIRVTGDNVASRILPVKINDLDSEDKTLLEEELGGVLRAVEFIYREPGVNRPLTPDDDEKKNLNKTKYRNQINKVANAVKEIIKGLKYPGENAPTKRTGIAEKETGKRKIPLKKVAFPLVILAVILITFLLIIPSLIKKSSERLSAVGKSIAVLPVNNFTGNPDLEPFTAGIHDALIGQLGRISNLVVKSRTSTLQFRDSKESIQQIAKKLGANNIVESSVVGSKDSLQIIVQLIEVFPVEKHIWSATFDQNWNNIMRVYSDIIRHIASGIQIKLTPQEENKLTNVQKHNPDLIKAIYNGSFYMNQLTSEGFQMGLKFFNEAIAIDPSDALPYLGLALGYSNASHVSAVSPDASDRAIAYAHQALSLDSSLSEAYIVLAARSLYTDWDFAATKRYLKYAMELNPNIPMVHYHYGWFLMLSNNVDGAIAEFKRSIEIDPIDAAYTCNLAGLYLWIGRYREALAEARKGLELNPKYALGFWVMGSAYAEMDMYNEAIETHKKGLAISPEWESGLGVAYARAGQREKALEVAAELKKNNDKWYTWGIADIYTALGDYEKAIYWIEEAYKWRHDFAPYFKYYAAYRPLYNDPRFKEIISRINIPK
jgi:tetratricopeptide (TPR) repeat protein